MQTSKVIYCGNLRTECTHIESGNVIITDAPKDNKGNGEAFSPTDLTATSLASCMMTIMGIAVIDKNIAVTSIEASVKKIMDSNPRRIKAIEIEMHIQGSNLTEKEKIILEQAARTCPVAMSLNPDIQQDVSFVFI